MWLGAGSRRAFNPGVRLHVKSAVPVFSWQLVASRWQLVPCRIARLIAAMLRDPCVSSQFLHAWCWASLCPAAAGT